MAQKLLEGEIDEAPKSDASEVANLRAAMSALTRELNAAHDENEELRVNLRKSGAPVERIRQLLEPWHKALKALFGELDELELDEPASGDSANAAGAATGNDPRVIAVWESWKQKMPGVPAEIITALLVHVRANAASLKVLCKRDVNTIYNAIARMKSAGIIVKGSDGKFELKKL